MKKKEQMNIVIAGHVDHGKSTIIGRLLADTDSLPEGKLEQVKQTCERNSKPFEYAFLLDALKDEQSQGITIDSARVFFSTDKRDYIIIDAPGHIEFLKNMVTGASRAEAALLVIDADEGVQENSKRHGYMISMLGIEQMVVLVNKMDLVDYSREVYERVKEEYREFLSEINLECEFVPVSGMCGDNLAGLSDNMPWYKDKTVFEVIDSFEKAPADIDKPFRMPVQGVYKFTKQGDNRRIVAGNVQSGQIKVGDDVVFYPSGKKSRVNTIEAFNSPPLKKAYAGQATAFTMDEQIYISRGEVAALTSQKTPRVSTRVRANLFWMAKAPLIKDKTYYLKTGTAKQEVKLEEICKIIDASDLDFEQKKKCVEHHDVAECILNLKKPLAFDLTEDLAGMSRFVIVDDYEIAGGGIMREALPDKQVWVRDKVMTRNLKWEPSTITREQRAERYNQKASLVVITGRKNVGKKTLAKALESRLFSEGKIVYFLGIGNVLYGVDADIKEPGKNEHHDEHLRRLAEVSNLMLDAGVIVIVTAIGLKQDDLNLIEAAVDTDMVNVVWIGDEPTDITYDVKLPLKPEPQEATENIKSIMQKKGVIFTP